MNQIACSSSAGLTAIKSLNYLRPLYAALPLILAGTTASRSITTGVRQFSTPVRTFNKLQSSAARQTPLTSGAIAIVRHFSSSQPPDHPLDSYQNKSPTNSGIRIPKESTKITWVIKNFSSSQSESIYSDTFVVGGCKWFLEAYPKGYNYDNHLSLFLEVHDSESLPHGWRRHAQCLLTILNQNPDKNIQLDDVKVWFDDKVYYRGHISILPFDKLVAEENGFLVNGELKIVAKIDFLEAIGELDVTEETTTSTVTETKNVKGFQLLSSQAETVSRVFERHPEIASELRATNPTLRTGYLSFLLSLIETMCQSPQELSKDDMTSAHAALKYMTDAGFKLDWLQKKLDELCEIKEKEKVCETQLQEMEKELKSLKMKCSDMEALVQKEKAKMSATKHPFSFDYLV
ncbi:unnamed protein product [Microthlaspi erraticum]|uniref:MATH domain-containing protein n=1 Tax=Microthlaspi erraticum TaxID=1685480 RepID=A0A6D2LD79_9BRAS|nr:unnamed protein product [Microthlaspi erraticum]